MALLDPDNVELVKLFGEFEANAMTKKVRDVCVSASVCP